ncbi:MULTISPECIES: condensation domain-containing protein [Vibrio]|uniref:Condensation domain-containing protein n=2 Tax=Vibrio TaxID=662 RepID=A0A0H3ZYB1_9VIBR|nr:condensation domain-containing protein [Vibrio kanaloae]AKN37707.1 non-ribosomal peptide synthetase [Vibrio sp. 1S_269]AKN35673.1 non-ribosomal peptide synthetase [Vibrio kanaloae]AKN37361.1 non-ribosomal peptide synthetase [Vibrio kanaloae]AKN38854.1 non-ribosomal peptide synthetase [Vibrio kanaloae]AKN39706.1 non-ribosomal peptide synthetase [Vibrio kanaloae]
MNKVKRKPKILLSISEHEEEVWIQQLQDPRSIEWKVEAYTIDITSKNEQIIQAVKKLALNDMQLNLRYRFSDEFELEKWHSVDSEGLTKVNQVEDEQLSDQVTAMKLRPWEPDFQPPFGVTILQKEKEKYLLISTHPILDLYIKNKSIINNIKSNYESLNTLGLESRLSPIDLDLNNFDRNNNKNIEQIILSEFRSSLDDPEVELGDDFFEMGGHSLLATRIIGNLMNNHDIEINFNDFFKSPSAQALARCVSPTNKSSQNKPVDIALSHDSPSIGSKLPLSFAQSFLWNAHLATGQSAIFNLPFAIRFGAEVDEEVFKLAFSDLLIRHTGLRTLFNDGSQQVIDEKDLIQYPWFWSSAEAGTSSLESEASYIFDLSKELPLRIRFFKDEKTNQQVLSFLIHHMIIDEWSLNNLMSELSDAYLARSQNQEPEWDKPAYGIHNYALAQKNRGPIEEDINYWVNHLRGSTSGLNLTSTEPDKNGPEVNPIEANWIEIDLGPSAYHSVHSLAREYNSSIFSVVYSAIAQALHNAGNLKDLVIGTSASGRDDAKYFDSVGYFTTMVAHRVIFEPDQSFGKLIENVTMTINDSMPHATVPIDMVQRELDLDPKNGLLFDVYAQIHADNALYGSLQTPNNIPIPYQQILPNKNKSLFGLHFEIMENVIGDERTLRLIVTYQTARYDAKQVVNIGQQMKATLTGQTVHQQDPA